MSIFSRSEPDDAAEPRRFDRDRAWNGSASPTLADIKTGIDAIRARTWSVWRRGNLAKLSRDLQIPLAALQASAQSAGSLPEEALHKLTKEFFTNVKFDPVSNLLVDVSPVPPSFPQGCVPAPFPKVAVPTNYINDPTAQAGRRKDQALQRSDGRPARRTCPRSD
jgi:hypothetical protein